MAIWIQLLRLVSPSALYRMPICLRADHGLAYGESVHVACARVGRTRSFGPTDLSTIYDVRPLARTRGRPLRRGAPSTALREPDALLVCQG